MAHGCYSDSDMEPPAKVTVDGTRIPVMNDGLRTEFVRDGAMDVTRFSEVYFPVEWNGTDYGAVVDALDPNATSVYDPVDIEIRDYANDGYETVHRGFVMGVGGGSHGEIEHRMTVGDVGQLLGAIPFDGRYVSRTHVFEAVKDVLKALQEAIVPHVFDELTFIERDASIPRPPSESDDDDGNEWAVTSFGALLEIAEGSDELTGGVSEWFFKSEKVFQGHKHTAADTLDWISDHVEGIFYFEPHGNSIALVYDEGYSERTYTATHVERPDGVDRRLWEESSDGEVIVFRNNALHEIRPANMAIVRGAATDGEVPQAAVVYEPLWERAGVAQAIQEQDDSVDTIESTIARAKNLLEEEITAASLGRILTAPAPQLRPGATIISQPSCGPNVDASGPPLNFQVQSLTHNIAATDQDQRRRHQTEIRATVDVRMGRFRVINDETRMVRVEPDAIPGWKEVYGTIIDTVGRPVGVG